MRFGNKVKHEHPTELDDALYNQEESRVGTLWSASGNGRGSASPDVLFGLSAGVCSSAAVLAQHPPCANSMGWMRPTAPTS